MTKKTRPLEQDKKADSHSVKKTIEIIVRIFLFIPTFLVLLEIFLFGWQPRSGFFSNFYNPHVRCKTEKSPVKIESAHYTYDIEVAIEKPIIEFVPFSPHKTHNINLYTFLDTYVDSVTAPDEVALNSIRYSLGEKEGSKRGLDFSYRFVDADKLKFKVKVGSSLNLGKNECAVNVSFY